MRATIVLCAGPRRSALATAAAMALALWVAPTEAAAADTPAFELPVDCDMAAVCSIQKYVDHDPSAEREDYACGRLSLDGDTGTDFRVPDYPAMRRGTAVIAAAPGVVKAVRDGMADVNVHTIGHAALKGRDAGNGVVIDHGGGWETQYSHLKKGSVAVKPGQRVETGDHLGLIGLSGNTEFPHVEFSVRHRGQPVDPFVGIAEGWRCGDPRTPLWSAAAAAHMPYRPTVPLIAGFATVRPEAEAAREGAYAAERLSTGVPALILWVDMSGTLAGDEERFRITGPDGAVLLDKARPLPKNAISRFAFAGLRPPPTGWVPGPYRGTYTLTRNGETAANIEATVEIAPPQ